MHVMIDLETLDTKPGAVILSIGALAFDPLLTDNLPKPENTGLVFYQNLTIFDQLLLGCTINPGTVKFWTEQSPAARSSLERDQISLQAALFRLLTWFRNLPGKEPGKVWANSPEFDCSILEESGRRVGVDMPWTFRDKADLRTFMTTIGMLPTKVAKAPPPERSGVHHNALDDCYYQAQLIQWHVGSFR